MSTSEVAFSGGLPELDVRSIWEGVDSGSLDDALEKSNALVSKHPYSPYALALKAMALESMGEKDAALALCLAAKEILFIDAGASVVDGHILRTLYQVFRRLGHAEAGRCCYELACNVIPNNLELMVGLFHCYVLEYAFLKQQQIALKLYKIGGEERFLIWAVCSIYLQVSYGDGGEDLLRLAEGLLKQHVVSHGLHELEALNVYLYLLEEQHKFEDALEILNGNLGSLMTSEVHKLKLQGRLLARLGDYVAASDKFFRVLELCPDDWDSFQRYLGSLLEDDSFLSKRTGAMPPLKSTERQTLHLSQEVFDSCISNAVSIIEKVMAKPDQAFSRWAYLTQLEIGRCKLLFGKGDADGVVENLVQYFERFGNMGCFISDVKMLLEVLDHERKIMFLKKSVQYCEAGKSLPTKALGQFISVLKLQNLIENMQTLPVEDLEDRVLRVAEMFLKAIPLSNELDAHDSKYCDELLSLAHKILTLLFHRTRDVGYMLESIMLLEFGSSIRRHVVQYKYSLVQIYSYWNSLPFAYERYKSLDVKNVFLEPITQDIVSRMLMSLLWPDLNDFIRDYMKFMDNQFRESANGTFLAYYYQNYLQAIRSVDFKDKLQRSSMYSMLKIEVPILQLKQNSNSIGVLERKLERMEWGISCLELANEITGKPLASSKDLKMHPWWTATNDKNNILGFFEGASHFQENRVGTRKFIHQSQNLKDSHTEEAEANMLKILNQRSLLPRLLYISMRSASTSIDEIVQAKELDILPNFSMELKGLLEQYAETLESPFMNAVELVLGVSSNPKAFEVLEKLVILNPAIWRSLRQSEIRLLIAVCAQILKHVPGQDVSNWMSFAVFLNAWNMNSHEIKVSDGDPSIFSTWHLVDSFLQKCVLHNISSARPIASSPGHSFLVMVQLVTEPLSWHDLIIRSCVTSLLSCRNIQQTGGSSFNSHSKFLLLHELQNSIQSLCETLEMVAKWLREQIAQSDVEKFNTLFSKIRRNGRKQGPGKVFEILESYVSEIKEELDHEIVEALQSWSCADAVRKMIAGQQSSLSQFLSFCESKITSLQELTGALVALPTE